MIQSYTKYKQFKSLVDAKDNGKAVRSGLDFLHFVAEEYSRLEVYNNQYTEHVIDDLRKHLSYAKSKSYGYIVDDIKDMYTCCEVSKKLILDFVEEVEYNYGNRPALMRLLRN